MLVCVTVFVIAGIWQIQRGQAKANMLTQRQAVSKEPAQPLASMLDADGTLADARNAYGQGVFARGRYDGAHQILLDNQTDDGKVGFHVWTPLVLDGGQRILIDRGWVPLGSGGRDNPPEPPAPDGEVNIHGLLRGLPEPGIRLGAAQQCKVSTWPRILNYPTIDTVRCQYSAAVINGLVLLGADAPHGFVRKWQTDVGMSPERHYAYAVQWFAMAIAVFVVFFVVNMKRKS